ncbi:MAG: hypothetical protein M3Z66_12520 [Chloroflexota bacterium]|nr:hypothetical protein [Chloroflexota bacterium]
MKRSIHLFASRQRVVRTFVGIAAVLAFGLAPAMRVGAATGPSTQVGSVAIGHLARVTVVNPRSLPRISANTSGNPRSIPIRFPYMTASQQLARAAAAASATSPRLTSSSAPGTASLLHSFVGITAPQSQALNGFDVEPPDQGLCVGNGAVVEMVNLAASISTPTGAPVLPSVSLNAFFGETSGFTSTFISDPRCYYDASAKAWFATVLEIDSTGLASHFDVAVDPTPDPTMPWTIYHFDTTDNSDPGCPCFGDQPLLGVDKYGVFVSTNEFSISGPNFNGAQVYAIDKAQLLSGAASPFFVHYSGLMNGGGMAASMEPAINTGPAPAEYFLDSLDFNATYDTRLGVWALTNEAALDKGSAPTLSGIVIHSEQYGQPPLAEQAGSSATLNTDDDRMLQVTNVDGTLYASLNTVLLINGDSQTRSAAAWFEVAPYLKPGNPPTIGGANITGQGYVGIKGNYLLYPAVAVGANGNPAMVMTASGPTVFPSAIVATGATFGTLSKIAAGTGPDTGFTCTPTYGGPPCRWGDYSAAVRDSASGNLWMATEYIGPPGDQFANWATRVFEITP